MFNVRGRPKPYTRDQRLMVQVRRLHPNVESLFEQFYRFSSWPLRLEVADFGFFEVHGTLQLHIAGLYNLIDHALSWVHVGYLAFT